ncbi:MAG: hypothetical protein M3O15_08815 [Acidobacteriota bacterium]|nr:hypothetical protein [Acidobacteriota bacterium]
MKSTFVRRATFLPLAALIAALSLTGCSKKEEAPAVEPAAAPAPAAAPVPTPPPASTAPVTVTSVNLGKSLGTGNKVAADADTFAAADTIYAAVGTTGAAPSAKLTAKWSFVGKTGAEKPVSEETRAIAPTGEATTEFHIAKASGWPAGDYKVEILLDGKSVATKAFRVGR